MSSYLCFFQVFQSSLLSLRNLVCVIFTRHQQWPEKLFTLLPLFLCFYYPPMNFVLNFFQFPKAVTSWKTSLFIINPHLFYFWTHCLGFLILYAKNGAWLLNHQAIVPPPQMLGLGSYLFCTIEWDVRPWLMISVELLAPTVCFT